MNKFGVEIYPVFSHRNSNSGQLGWEFDINNREYAVTKSGVVITQNPTRRLFHLEEGWPTSDEQWKKMFEQIFNMIKEGKA